MVLSWLTMFLVQKMASRDDDLPFRIELWDDKGRHVEELIALVSEERLRCL